MFVEPPWINTPTWLGAAAVPARSVPIRLPRTILFELPEISTPMPVLPEMTFSSCGFVPPISTPVLAPTPMPNTLSGDVPTPGIATPPITLPRITSPAGSEPSPTASSLLPAMRLPAPVPGVEVAPPIVLPPPDEENPTPTTLGKARVPVLSVPIKSPSTRLPVVVGPKT